jgi:hypothetical protein
MKEVCIRAASGEPERCHVLMEARTEKKGTESDVEFRGRTFDPNGVTKGEEKRHASVVVIRAAQCDGSDATMLTAVMPSNKFF